jgi:hypothetical protein
MINEPETDPELSFKEVEKDQSTTGPIQEIDTANPLYFQLSSMASSRYAALKPISDEIVSLLKRQTLSTQPDFTSRLIKLQQKYTDADREEQNKIFKKFHTITQDHQFLPAEKFLDFIHATGLKTLFQEYLLSQKKKSKEIQISDEQIDQQFQNIQASTTWQELEQHAAQINQFLQFDRVYDEGRLISFQNSARSIVTQKLNQFILSSTEALPANAFNPEYLQTLINIIKSVWITDPDMHDFYIAEFELREPIPESN